MPIRLLHGLIHPLLPSAISTITLNKTKIVITPKKIINGTKTIIHVMEIIAIILRVNNVKNNTKRTFTSIIFLYLNIRSAIILPMNDPMIIFTNSMHLSFLYSVISIIILVFQQISIISIRFVSFL